MIKYVDERYSVRDNAYGCGRSRHFIEAQHAASSHDVRQALPQNGVLQRCLNAL